MQNIWTLFLTACLPFIILIILFQGCQIEFSEVHVIVPQLVAWKDHIHDSDTHEFSYIYKLWQEQKKKKSDKQPNLYLFCRQCRKVNIIRKLLWIYTGNTGNSQKSTKITMITPKFLLFGENQFNIFKNIRVPINQFTMAIHIRMASFVLYVLYLEDWQPVQVMKCYMCVL